MPPTLLRLATAGSVDDGKSTLIGRLLYDSKSLMSDQVADAEVDLSRLTDGLRAEREQGITIDVAYRFFATPRRSFIIADTPGHVRYTRNMVTGASTAQAAIVLVDARHGLLEQSHRHAYLSALLGIRHMVACVNKMDLVDWDEARFREIEHGFAELDAAQLGVPDALSIPVSALLGDNVVEPSAHTPWYDGAAAARAPRGARGGQRPQLRRRCGSRCSGRSARAAASSDDYRGYAGQMAGGVLRAGRRGARAAATGERSTVERIDTSRGPGRSARSRRCR